MTMIERVARALIDADPHVHGHCAEHIQMKRGAARAAIEAMRYPTELMIDAGWEAYKFDPPALQATWEACLAEGITVVWADMIDAALSLPPAPPQRP